MMVLPPAFHFQVLQSATLRVVGVECLHSVAVLHVHALPELVIPHEIKNEGASNILQFDTLSKFRG